jgi:DMSO/TMAO reductase YedYZ molybdopterin-dependent catalytic subunit
VLAAAVAVGLVPSAMTAAATIPADGMFPDLKKWPESTTEKQASFKDITTYNNFYEFGTDKGDPAVNAHTLKTSPWSVEITGECGKPGTLSLEDILKPHALEERVYRHRCVEAWSMVIPWVGFPLADLLQRFEPTSKAKYVQFFTLADKQQMPGVRYPGAQLAVPRGPHDCGGDASAHARDRRPLRQGAAKPERRTTADRDSLEVRLQGREVGRPYSFHGPPARDELEHGRAERVRLLLERQPE